MIKRDVLVFLMFGFIAVLWSVYAGRSGYTGNNAMIVARSLSVVAAIDGEVNGLPVKVGSIVAEGDLAVRIENARIDRSRLTDLESQIEFYRSEISNAAVEREQLTTLLEHFEKQATMYSKWLVQDLRLRRQEAHLELERAKERESLKSSASRRTTELSKKSLVSTAELERTQGEAAIAQDQVDSLRVRLSRIDLMLQSIEGRGVPREDGDTSYWDKSVDALRARLFDNQNRSASMRAQLARAESQAKEEKKRLALNFVEEHRAPVNGVINAIFTTEGKRVTAGAPMLEILDCAHPIAIVAIPDNRFGEFRIGQKATVRPIDSDEIFSGSIQHITSGPLIGRDTTIAIQQTVTIDGNKAIVSLDERGGPGEPGKFCNSARRAIVTIHTRSLFDRIAEILPAEVTALDIDSLIDSFASSFQKYVGSILSITGSKSTQELHPDFGTWGWGDRIS
jgi:multidrug resistance efflux pump